MSGNNLMLLGHRHNLLGHSILRDQLLSKDNEKQPVRYELSTRIQRLSLGQDLLGQEVINTLTHVAWMASDITNGGRPWNAGSKDNYHAYNQLTPEVQILDAQASSAPLAVLSKDMYMVDSATTTMERILKRENGPFPIWEAPELAVLTAAMNWPTYPTTDTKERRRVPVKSRERYRLKTFDEEVTDIYDEMTMGSYSIGKFKGNLPNHINQMLVRGEIAHDVGSGEWNITELGEKREEVLRGIHTLGMFAIYDPVENINSYVETYSDVAERYQIPA